MLLRNITMHNSVKNIAQIGRTQDRDVKPNTIKNKSLPCKQNEKCFEK